MISNQHKLRLNLAATVAAVEILDYLHEEKGIIFTNSAGIIEQFADLIRNEITSANNAWESDLDAAKEEANVNF